MKLKTSPPKDLEDVKHNIKKINNMNKYILAIFTLIALCACISKDQSRPLLEGDQYDYPDRQLKYRDHIYYMWHTNYGIAVVHNPDCPCHKKEDKSEHTK